MIDRTLVSDSITAHGPPPSVPATAVLRDAAAALVAGGLGAVAVMGDGDRLLGLLSANDILGLLVGGEDLDETSAEDVVVDAGDSLRPDDTQFDALSLMVLRGVTHLPVLDGDRLVGIASASQLLKSAYHELDRSYMDSQAGVFGRQVVQS